MSLIILATSVIILDVIVSTVLTTNVDLFKELERYLSRTSVTVFSGVAVYVAIEASKATADVNTFVIAV